MVDVVTVARTEYSASAKESIGDAAEGSCNSGDELDDKSLTGSAGSPSSKMGPIVGRGRVDGKVGVPANVLNGTPSPRKNKISKQQQRQPRVLSTPEDVKSKGVGAVRTAGFLQ